ncbi:MAG: bifunctional diaminohydroxyphosphoribosylaminopyrimidine deaminase/5-amino-6-(5-phosphoribosylamino)uracil reductase RibD [Mariprofundales bacterium]|nr:bifunctional diaminohydroxyphosphoribosylaminopyrimidine deaminase/5-amino-6-(5-phosphoribosylamino)uracil reductase RibD [Mariprofundales bacterium]
MNDERWMREALKLARNGIATSHPNPRVGAVVIRNNQVVGRGWHTAPGEAHAEIMALADAGEAANGATLVVTLEPCSACGRTAPCTEAVVAAAINRVVFGSHDINPAMAGGGKLLADHGVTVTAGVLAEECDLLNRPFFHGLQQHRPWIVAKAATSLDGNLATAGGDSRWISNPAARKQAHRLRAEVDAIIIGAGTLRCDNPQLTPRGVRRRGEAPLRVVICRTLPQFKTDYHLANIGEAATRIYSQQLTDDAMEWQEAGVEIVTYSTLHEIAAHLYTNGDLLVMVEGGGELYGALLRAQLIDEMVLFQAPLLIGGERAVHLWGGDGSTRVANAPRMINIKRRSLGDNQMIRGELIYP